MLAWWELTPLCLSPLPLQRLEGDMVFLPGDCLLASAFLSYVGPFLSQYRDELVQETWLKQVCLSDIEGQQIDHQQTTHGVVDHHTRLAATTVTTTVSQSVILCPSFIHCR